MSSRLSENIRLLQSNLSQALETLAEAQNQTRYLMQYDPYELPQKLREITENAYETLRYLHLSREITELLQELIGNQFALASVISPGNLKLMSEWKPKPPEGIKPNLNDINAAEWRYQRYQYEQYQAGKQEQDILTFEIWKERYFNPAAQGGRPGRPGGSQQVAARQALVNEGFKNVENVELGGRYPDMVRYNLEGSIDYIEVVEMLQNGMPEARERFKIADEIPALGEKDSVTFVDKMDISRRISYYRGDDVETKILGDRS